MDPFLCGLMDGRAREARAPSHRNADELRAPSQPQCAEGGMPQAKDHSCEMRAACRRARRGAADRGARMALPGSPTGRTERGKLSAMALRHHDPSCSH